VPVPASAFSDPAESTRRRMQQQQQQQQQLI